MDSASCIVGVTRIQKIKHRLTQINKTLDLSANCVCSFPGAVGLAKRSRTEVAAKEG